MRIHTLEKPNPNAYFPVAHTCFFSIELPKYTSRDHCYKKLLWAINSESDRFPPPPPALSANTSHAPYL